MPDCKCGHLVCTFPNCDNGEFCSECGIYGDDHHITCAKSKPVTDFIDTVDHGNVTTNGRFQITQTVNTDDITCKECGLIIGTCDKCFNGD